MEFFPYPPRAFQAEAVALVASAAREGQHLALEMPTGTGKTVTLLAGAIQASLGTGRRILYVTRTNSQQEQAMRELSAIRGTTQRPLRAFALQGRHRLCLRLEEAEDPELAESNAEELGQFCSHAKRATEADASDPRGCHYYGGLLAMEQPALEAAYGPDPRTAESFRATGREQGFCSYEATKRLLPEADVVVAPYVFAFDPGLRARLLQWWGVATEDIVLVVDEAHNLPGFLRELHSPKLSKEGLRRALSESESLHHPGLVRGVTSRTLLESLAEILDRVVREFATEDDGFVPPFEVEGDLLERFHFTSNTLLQAADALAHLGETIRDRRRLQGKIPRSALTHVGGFLRRWIVSDEDGAVKLVLREPRPALESFCVDAKIGATVLHEFHATIHASGTLAPLSEYRDALGLGDAARLERFPSPFPPENLQVAAVRGFTTRFRDLQHDPRQVDRLQEAARTLLGRFRVNAAVFFPSHQLLAEFDGLGILDAGGADVLVESRAMDQERLMRLVADHRTGGGLRRLAGVLGGRLSEGLDFPGRQLEAVLIVGAPFPKPTARQRALFHYYETRHGRGWDYAVHAPAVRRLRQAIGRLVRGPDDRGIALVLDERAAGLLQSAGIPCELVELEEAVGRIERFQTPLADRVK